MCHGKAVQAFPTPTPATVRNDRVTSYVWTNASAAKRIAILPDIYGCNPFYRGLATRFAQTGAEVYLVDTFAGLGDLPEMTREAAFARRHKVQDKSFLDQFETFVQEQGITGVIGFCLGGLYVFELARRGLKADMIGLYGFPQGLPNSDALPVPFDYLEDVKTPFSMLMGAEDPSVGPDTIKKLAGMSPSCPAMSLTIYDGVGHDFLPLLDSDEMAQRAAAEDALSKIDAALLSA